MFYIHDWSLKSSHELLREATHCSLGVLLLIPRELFVMPLGYCVAVSIAVYVRRHRSMDILNKSSIGLPEKFLNELSGCLSGQFF